MTTKDLDRIQALIRLALNNPSEQESLRAALAAVKLIDKHKALRAADAKAKGSTYNTAWFDEQSGPLTENQVDFLFKDRIRKAQEAQREAYERYTKGAWSGSKAADPQPEPPINPTWKEPHIDFSGGRRGGKTTYPPYDKDGNPTQGGRKHEWDYTVYACRKCGTTKLNVVTGISSEYCPL